MISAKTKNAIKYKALRSNEIGQTSTSRPIKRCILFVFSICIVSMLVIISNDEQEMNDLEEMKDVVIADASSLNVISTSVVGIDGDGSKNTYSSSDINVEAIGNEDKDESNDNALSDDEKAENINDTEEDEEDTTATDTSTTTATESLTEDKSDPKKQVDEEEDGTTTATTEEVKNESNEPKEEKQQTQDNIIDLQKFKNDLQKSLEEVTKKVRLEYGSYLEKLLFQTIPGGKGGSGRMPDLLDKIFPSSVKAKERFMRRIQIKFLQSNLPSKGQREYPVTFTWQTAGHSASAAHGNLFNESYTSLLEDTVKTSFSSVNIDFRGYNFAMGGMSSNPELSLCEEAVYGPDIDVLLWDFGMTDGRATHGINLFSHRAALHPTRPILVGLTGGRMERATAFFNMERQANISSIAFDSGPFGTLTNSFPDSMHESNIDDIPYALRYYICDGKIETGDVCGPHKYDTNLYCKEKIHGQVGWHPGWKDHMLKGRLMGLYVLHILYQAITNLVDKNNANPKPTDLPSFLEQLLLEEKLEKEYYQQHITNLENSSSITNKIPTFNIVKDDSINLVLFFKRAICRTALLPSHTRYNDALFDHITPNDYSKTEFLFTHGLQRDEYKKKVSPLAHASSGHDPYYSTGRVAEYYNQNNPIKTKTLSSVGATKQFLPLVHQENDNSKVKGCTNIQLDIDYKDNFLIGKDNSNTIQIPYESELLYYNHSNNEKNVTNAAIMIVLFTCPWNKCPKDYIKIDTLLKQTTTPDQKNATVNVRFKLNDHVITEVEKISNNAFMLRNMYGGIDFDYDGKTPLNLSFQVLEENQYFYVTSIIFFQW